MRRWVGVVVVVLAAARASAAPEPQLVELTVDGAPHGDAVVLVDDAAIWVPATLLCELRLCRVGGLERDGVRYLALATLGEAVTHRFDRTAGALWLYIDAAALNSTTIALGGQAPPDLERASALSAFLNYALQLDAGGAYDTRARFGATLESGMSIDGDLAYSSMSVVSNTRVQRGLSNYTVDWRDRLAKFVAGDDLVTGGALGGGGVIGGLHFASDFSIDPYFIAQPTLTQSGVVTMPSTVEVYRDGQLIRREAIPAGPYRVEDFAGTLGGDTKVVVVDAFGQARSVATSLVAPTAAALRPGLSMWDYALGFLRSPGVGNFDYGAPVLFAVHRLGITPALTLGGRLEATMALVSSGGSALVTRGHAVVEFDAAASATGAGASSSAAINLAWRDRTISVALLLRAVGRRYATSTLDPHADRALGDAELSASWSATSWSTLLVQAAAERMRDTGDRLRVGATGGVQLDGGSRLFLSLSAVRDAAATSAEASVTFSWSWGQHATASTTATAAHDPSVAAAVSRALPGTTGVGYEANATLGRAESGFVRAIGQGELGRVDASVNYTGGMPVGSFGVSGALVAVGGAVKATRAVQGGFALVRVADTPEVRTYLNNQPVGSTDGEGELIIPELQSNYGNRIRIDARDLPLDISTLTLERTIAPPRRGGVIVELAPRRVVTVRGRLIGSRGGQPLDVSFGELIIDRTAATPVGHDGAFEIEAVRAGRHHGEVQIDGMRCGFDIDLPAGAAFVDLGTVTCEVVAP